jgi:adenylosuccinate lyase
MLSRYARPEMAAIWEAQTRFRIWFEIEAHAADALAELGVIPKEAAKTVWDKARDVIFDVARIDEIERETKHDVIAFLTHLAEIVGPEARFVHQGMTSSDVLDTCLNVQLTRAADLLVDDIDKILAALKKRAFEHKMTPTIGRSHGIHAEPVTFGLKLAYAYAEFSRARARLVTARKEVATCAIRAPSAPSRKSIRASKPMSQKQWGWYRNRSRPKSFRATATRCILRRLA